uniref:Aquaporin 14 n=1 Tax=Gopherus agassizii TaxID=38772 RepID=A0A452GSN4_9SAUR
MWGIGSELRSRRFWRSLLAEAAATLIFVWLVLGASCPGGPGRVTAPPALQPALTAGLAAVGLAHCFGEVSGAQANPALTLALLCTHKLDALRGAAYVLAQCLGAVLASAAVYLALTAALGNAGQALAMETFSTFQLVFTIFAVEDQRRRGAGEPGGLAIGFSVTAGALAGTFSGGSMNPARSLGPAVLTGIWDHHWVRRWVWPSQQRPCWVHDLELSILQWAWRGGAILSTCPSPTRCMGSCWSPA